MSSLLQANGITKRYGDKLLFENINFYVDVGDKIAIVGLNGSGKTSLLRILSGEESSNAGSISLKRDLKIAVLEQDFKLNPDNTVLEAVLHDSGDLYACISNYENALNSGDTEQIQTSIEQMDALQAWDYEAKMKQILGKLKIDEFDKKISVLSGGQKKRVALAAVLIQDFDLLILDEPTNHLDLDMIEWLEEYLDNEVKSLVTITHDRYFLDRVCNRIAEIDDKTMYFYEGNYSKFVELKNLREEIHAASVEKAKNLLSTEIDWLRRMPKARTTKSKYRIKAAEELSEKARTQKNDASFEIKVQASRLGSKIVNLKNISKSFGEKKVIDEFSYIFAPHEKIGIVGNNGTGKTTLLKLITQQLNPDKGKISIGETVKFAYYKQDGLNFDKNDRPIDVVSKIADVVKMADGNKISASAFLQMFRFRVPQQYEKIEKLSGGEKQRLYLCTVLMQEPNFLILDEPTNDLDIITLQILEDYLVNFQGCVLIVSHDRFFLDKIVEHIFVFNENGNIKNFPGNYSQYRYSKEFEEQNKPKVSELKKEIPKLKKEPKKKIGLTYKERIEFEEIEKILENLETEKEELSNKLNSGIENQEDLFQISNRVGEIISKIDELEMRWLELSEKQESK